MRLLGKLLAGASLAVLVWWEWRKPLRAVRESRISRDLRNLAIAATAGVTIRVVETPIASLLVREGERRRWGLLKRVHMRPTARLVTSLLLFDYTLYLWHVMTHRIPLLWRFHQVHHIDREMDASTAIRFHFGEMMLSVPFRAAQIRIIGPSEQAFAYWQAFLFACILFHHSNAKLPLAFERRLAWFLMTPRLHGIHHSVVPQEVNSNWSSGLTLWDWLHGTLRTEKPQARLTLGVPGQRADEDVRLRRVLALPFTDGVAEIAPGAAEPVREPLKALS